jgi:hypothetical protein
MTLQTGELLGSITAWMPRYQHLRTAKKRLKRKLFGKPPATLRLSEFHRSCPELSSDSDDLGREISAICRYEKLDSSAFRQWLQQLGLEWRTHRKMWELAYICQALHERGMLQAGKRGLGFAVGAEALPAFFAARGVHIMASDLPADDSRNRAWAKTGQWAAGLEALRRPQLCPDDVFDQHVQFRPLDMNAIPQELTGFDFTWSTCSFEHCGSIELGLKFLREQMKCLAPGGIAVHTTEFNLSSNSDTRFEGNCVLFRLQDIERVFTELQAEGHSVEPIYLGSSSHPLDMYVDLPPYRQAKHLRLELFGFAATSIGLIIRKHMH